jgi:proton-dependent oligopeptide transporter, POT family
MMENQKPLPISQYRFPLVFWIANAMELLERWAYYGVFALLSVYLTDPASKGGLGFTSGQSGTLMAVVTFTIYFFPMLAGAIADKLGYRKILLIAFTILTIGYYLMGQFSSYHGIFLAFLLVGLGAAFFKPIIVGTVSKSTNASNDTVGFGLFYMIVNIGAFIGPYVASKLRDISWQYIFLMSAVVIAVNFIPALFLYREPGRKPDAVRVPVTKKFMEIFLNFFMVLSNVKFLAFVLIMSGFWVMYMQIFFTMPVYITQWVDTSVIYNSSRWIAFAFGSARHGTGVIHPEMIQNLGAACIVFFQVMMSNLVKKIAPIRSITMGILISALAMAAMSLGINGWIIVTAMFVFAFGEMISSPRTQEYVSRIAPADKVGVYMGFSFLPLAFGNLAGGFLYGRLYERMSDIHIFILKELAKRNVPDLSTLAAKDKDIIFRQGMMHLKMTAPELKSYLFDLYQPFRIWWVFGGIGLATVLLFLLYNLWIRKSATS